MGKASREHPLNLSRITWKLELVSASLLQLNTEVHQGSRCRSLFSFSFAFFFAQQMFHHNCTHTSKFRAEAAATAQKKSNSYPITFQSLSLAFSPRFDEQQ